jgi:hypothetical protein
MGGEMRSIAVGATLLAFASVAFAQTAPSAQTPSDGITSLTLWGFWIWGVLTVLLGLIVFIFLIWAALRMNVDNTFPGSCGKRLQVIYTVLKDHGIVVAGALAAGALAWSYFFSAIYKLKP